MADCPERGEPNGDRRDGCAIQFSFDEDVPRFTVEISACSTTDPLDAVDAVNMLAEAVVATVAIPPLTATAQTLAITRLKILLTRLFDGFRSPLWCTC